MHYNGLTGVSLSLMNALVLTVSGAVKTLKGKKSAGSSDDGSWDTSPYGTLTRSTGTGGTGASTDSNKYRANARAKLPSIFNPFVKVRTTEITLVSSTQRASPRTYKKRSCRRETARRFVSLSLKIIRKMTLLNRACVSP